MGMMIHRHKVMAAKAAVTQSREEKPAIPDNEARPQDEAKPQDDELTKDGIMKMPYFSLKSLAKKHGLEVEDKKADELKTELIETLGL